MRVLVTGATGFIGSALVTELLARGHDVAALTRQPEPSLPAGAVVLQGDLREPPYEVIRDFAPTVCVHSAWITTPGVFLESSENRDWVTWTAAFVERLAELGVPRHVVLGTCIEYAIGNEPLVENTTPLRPTTLYASSKAALRELLLASSKLQGRELAWARLFYLYGEGEHADRLCTSLITRFARGEPVSLKTPQSTKDYIHVSDVARALAVVAESSFCGDINVGTGEGVTVERIARSVAAKVGAEHLIQLPAEPGHDPFGFVVADVSRLKSLGWSPTVNLEQGIDRLIRHLSA